MNRLVVIPTKIEFDSFVDTISKQGVPAEEVTVGRLPVVRFSSLDMTVSLGGLGKVQFAIQTQHLIDALSNVGVVVCAGGAGSLSDNLSIGDVVIATETVEHDIRKLGTPLVPRFAGAESVLVEIRSVASTLSEFAIHFGPIASGDEDVMDVQRRSLLSESTGGLAVAWEGAGGARACEFSGVPFIEMRGIGDHAKVNAASEARAYLAKAVSNVATVILQWVRLHV